MERSNLILGLFRCSTWCRKPWIGYVIYKNLKDVHENLYTFVFLLNLHSPWLRADFKMSFSPISKIPIVLRKTGQALYRPSMVKSPIFVDGGI